MLRIWYQKGLTATSAIFLEQLNTTFANRPWWSGQPNKPNKIHAIAIPFVEIINNNKLHILKESSDRNRQWNTAIIFGIRIIFKKINIEGLVLWWRNDNNDRAILTLIANIKFISFLSICQYSCLCTQIQEVWLDVGRNCWHACHCCYCCVRSLSGIQWLESLTIYEKIIELI